MKPRKSGTQDGPSEAVAWLTVLLSISGASRERFSVINIEERVLGNYARFLRRRIYMFTPNVKEDYENDELD